MNNKKLKQLLYLKYNNNTIMGINVGNKNEYIIARINISDNSNNSNNNNYDSKNNNNNKTINAKVLL